MHLRVPATVLAILILAACGGTGEPPAQEVDEGAVSSGQTMEEAPMPFTLTAEQEEGRVVYETMCWSCHGSAGRGDGPAVKAGSVAAPRDFNASAFSGVTATQLQAEFRAQVGGLDEGHPHMQNVLNIVDEDAFSAALAYIPALTYPSELPGSAIAGRATYVLRCQGCHGTDGRGTGPGAEVLEMRPADFTQDTLLVARDFEGAFEKIRRGGGGVHGSSMPAWGVMLSDGDVWDLVAYISTFRQGILSSPPGGSR
jgi:mono/diheme cytochrome c family protein